MCHAKQLFFLQQQSEEETAARPCSRLVLPTLGYELIIHVILTE